MLGFLGTLRGGGLALASCLLAAALFGASTPAAKALLASFPPLLLSGVLYLGAALATAPSVLRSPRAFLQLGARNRRNLLTSILCGGVLGPVLMLVGLQHAGASSVAIWLALETVATTLIAWRWYGEHIDRDTLLALLLILAATAVLAPVEAAAPMAIACIALACIAWGIDNNATAVIDVLSPAQMTFAKGLVGGAVNIAAWQLLAMAEGSATTLPDAGQLLAALALGGVSYGVSITLYILGAQQLGASRSQLLFSTAPLWGVAMAWAWLHEAFTAAHGIALLLSVLAVLLIHRARHAHLHEHVALQHRHWHRHDDAHHAHAHAGEEAAASGWFGWHLHAHAHEAITHEHAHRPDLHHRHAHHLPPEGGAQGPATAGPTAAGQERDGGPR
jgi:drug/metabolite transporter (DMT)-like permease